MPTVADCLRRHAPAYNESFGHTLSLTKRKVLDAINRCRTGELGAVFLITFTVPAELRKLVRAHPRIGYDAIFDAGSETIRELASNPKWLGTRRIGFFGVLHTWGRDPMVYHPHVHFVVPGGGVSEDGGRWLSTPQNFFFPEACASPIYRAKFRDQMKEAKLDHLVDASVWSHETWWEVNVKPVGDGQAVLKYLAPYVHRVAISNNRIKACSDKRLGSGMVPPETEWRPKRTVRCPKCGASMRIVRIWFGNCRLLVTHALPYLDSG
jgi:hypothetical protein